MPLCEYKRGQPATTDVEIVLTQRHSTDIVLTQRHSIFSQALRGAFVWVQALWEPVRKSSAFVWVQCLLHLWGNRVPLCEYNVCRVPLCEYNESLWENRVPLCEYKGTRFSHRWSWPFSEVSLSLSQKETLSISHCLLVREGASVSFYLSLSLSLRETHSLSQSPLQGGEDP